MIPGQTVIPYRMHHKISIPKLIFFMNCFYKIELIKIIYYLSNIVFPDMHIFPIPFYLIPTNANA